jgi:hypothetical protein
MPHAAKMIQLEASRNRTLEMLIHEYMGRAVLSPFSSIRAICHENPVSARGKLPLPEPATRSFIANGETRESVDDGFSLRARFHGGIISDIPYGRTY